MRIWRGLGFIFFAFMLSLTVVAQVQETPTNSGGTTTESEFSQIYIDAAILQSLSFEDTTRVIILLRDPVQSNTSDVSVATQSHLQRDVLDGLSTTGFELTHQFSSFPALSGTVTATSLDILLERQDVLAVLPDMVMYPHSNGVPELGVDDVHNIDGITGVGVTVAVLDTGINKTSAMYAQMQDQIIAEACFSAYNCMPSNTSTSTDASSNDLHGTYVANVIAGATGYAPDANIVPVRVLDDSGNGYISDWLAALEWIRINSVQYGIDVVNMSIGTVDSYAGNCNLGDTTTSDDDAFFMAIADVLSDLRASGVVVVASTGNQGLAANNIPACFSDVLAVGATHVGDIGAFPADATYADITNGDFPDCQDSITSLQTMACFSNYGVETDILAPGVHVDDNGWVRWFGTSFSAPAVSGSIGLIKQQNATLTADEVRAALLNTANMTSSGFPLIDPPEAVSSVVTPCDVNIADGDINALNTAIANANNVGDLVTICLARNGYYAINTTLTSVTGAMTIEGQGATLQFAASTSTQYLSTSGTLTLQNLMLRGAEISTTVIDNSGNLSLQGVTLSGFIASTLIDNKNTINLTDVIFTVNIDTILLYQQGNAPIAVINQTALLSNHKDSSSLVGLIEITKGTATFIQTSFIENSGRYPIHIKGGSSDVIFDGILSRNNDCAICFWAEGNPNVIFNASTFQDNYGDIIGSYSNTLTITNSTFSNNYGRLVNFYNTIIQNSQFDNTPISLGSTNSQSNDNLIEDSYFYNSNSYAAIGILNGGGTTIRRSSFEDNAAALRVTGNLNLQDSTISNNFNGLIIGDSNQISSYFSTVNMTNITLYNNKRAILVADTPEIGINLNFSTLQKDFADDVPGQIFMNGASRIHVRNSILDFPLDPDACRGANENIIFEGKNYTSNSSCVAVNSILVTAQQLNLRPLGDYGGASATIALNPASIAINNAACTDTAGNLVVTDQRGITRPTTACDVGAFEYTLADLPPPVDNFEDSHTLEGIEDYSYILGISGSTQANEPSPCVVSLGAGESYHIAIVGRSNYRSLRSGRSNYRSLRSGDLYYHIDTIGSNYDTIIGVYRGDELISLTQVACDDDSGNANGTSSLILQIPANYIADELTPETALTRYRIIVWKKNLNQSNHTLKLNIEDITFRACDDVSQIPISECDALLRFYRLTDGFQWENADQWLDINLPCSWYGVSCSNDHVTALTFPQSNQVHLPDGFNNAYTFYQSLLGTTSGDGITVNTTAMTIADDGKCSIIEAFIAAEANTPSGLNAGECSAISDWDTIWLQANHSYIFETAYHQVSNLDYALPLLSTNFKLEGQGAILTTTNTNLGFIYASNYPTGRINIEISDLTVRDNVVIALKLVDAFVRLDHLKVLNTGGISISANDVYISDSVFENNQGRAIAFGRVSSSNPNYHIQIDQSYFIANSSGGAIYITDKIQDVLISNSVFINNYGGNQGGAIYNELSRLNNDVGGGAIIYNTNIENSVFMGNHANNGGVLHGAFNVSNSTFIDNWAFSGNILTDYQFNTTSQQVYAVNFANNTFINNGRLSNVPLFNSVYSEITLRGNLFQDNVGTVCQRALTGAEYNISDGVFSDCNASSATNLNTRTFTLSPTSYLNTTIYRPIAGSLPINRIPTIDCVWDHDSNSATPNIALTDDILGNSRPISAGCDVGAIEYDAAFGEISGLLLDMNSETLLTNYGVYAYDTTFDIFYTTCSNSSGQYRFVGLPFDHEYIIYTDSDSNDPTLPPDCQRTPDTLRVEYYLDAVTQADAVSILINEANPTHTDIDLTLHHIFDVNEDGILSPTDVIYVVNQSGTTDEIADINRDGIVDTADIQLLLDELGQ